MLHRASPSQISRKISFAIRPLFFNNTHYTKFSAKVEAARRFRQKFQKWGRAPLTSRAALS